MEVSLLFPRPFSGSIFTEKAFEKEACRWKGDGNTRLSISIPTADANLCGISEVRLTRAILSQLSHYFRLFFFLPSSFSLIDPSN